VILYANETGFCIPSQRTGIRLRHHFSSRDAQDALGISADGDKLALNRLAKRGTIASPALKSDFTDLALHGINKLLDRKGRG